MTKDNILFIGVLIFIIIMCVQSLDDIYINHVGNKRLIKAIVSQNCPINPPTD